MFSKGLAKGSAAVFAMLALGACGAMDDPEVEASPGSTMLTLTTVPTTAESTLPPQTVPTRVATTLPLTTLPPITTTTRPPTTTTPPAPAASCHPSYEGACLPADSSDVDCAGGGGNGPDYAQEKNFRVVGPDVYDLDRDGDGYACES